MPPRKYGGQPGEREQRHHDAAHSAAARLSEHLRRPRPIAQLWDAHARLLIRPHAASGYDGWMRGMRTPFLFSYHSIPELANVPKEQRKAFWKRAASGRGFHWREIVAVLVGTAALIACFPLAVNVAARRWSPPVVMFVAMIVWGAAWGLSVVNLVYRSAQARLRAHLAAAGRCSSCGYDVQGSPQRCPECGAEVQAAAPVP